MKKLLSILIISLAFASCSNDVEVEQPNGDPTAIEFGDVSTRVGVNDILEFGVYASVKAADAPTNVPLLINEKVSRPTAMDYFDYENTKYWIPNATHNFFAYYPYAVVGGDVSAAEALADNNGFKLTFTTPDGADCDLLTAHHSVLTGNDTSAQGPVAIDFDHALVNLNLNIWRDNAKHQNDKIRVKAVRLSNVAWSGTLTKTAESATWEYTSKEAINKVFDPAVEIGAAVLTGNVLEPGPSAVPAKPFGDGGLLVIPQPAGTITLRVVYELWLKGAADTEWNEYFIEINLPAATWTAGSRVTYNVLLSNIVDIAFYYISTSITPWGTPQVGGTIIIK